MQDSNLVLFNAALTSSAAGSWIDIGKGGVLDSFDVRVNIPSVSGTTPTLGIAFDFGDDGSTAADTYTVQEAGTAMANASAPYIFDKRLRTRHRYVRANFTSGGTTPNFGTTTVLASSGLSYREANIPNS